MLHSTYLLLASQMTWHGSFVHETDLLAFCDLHGLVREVYPSKEVGKLAIARLSGHRSGSKKAFAVLRDVACLVLFSFFAYCEQLSASFDPSRVIRLSTLCVGVSNRLLVSFWCSIVLVLVVDSIKARR